MSDGFRIISTLGPASANERFVSACAEVDQHSFRLNGSHLDGAAIEDLVGVVSRAAKGAEWQVVLDLQGDKRRIGELAEPLICNLGAELTLVEAEHGSEGELPVPHRALFARAEKGDELVLQDGAVRLEISSRIGCELRATVRQPGELRARCGIHINGKSLLGGELPAAQLEQIRVAARVGVQALALSYLRGREELDTLREACAQLDYHPTIVAKIERPEAFDNLEDICDAADELWLCRGDLGSLVPWRELGALQRRAFSVAGQRGCPLVVAGQVFHHLTEHVEPTRSEIVHFYEVVQGGAAGIVLSDETAIGVDPVGAVTTIASLL